MTTRFKFTKKHLLDLENTSVKRKYIYDQKIDGLGLSITQRGTKSFFVYRKINGIPKRITLGRFPDMTVEQARKIAVSTISDIACGKDPIAEKKAKKVSRITLQQVFDDYLDTHEDLKPGTILDYKASVNTTFKDWLDKPIINITENMILARYKKRGAESKSRANSAMRALRAILNFVIHRYKNEKGESILKNNPVYILSHTKVWFKVKRKTSYIKRTDLKPWFQSVHSLEPINTICSPDTIKDYLVFVLFTGVRRNEAAELQWNDVDFQEKTFTLQNTKNTEVVSLPMSSYIYDLLLDRHQQSTNKFVFPGKSDSYVHNPSYLAHRVSQLSGIKFSVHDLRRTFMTIGESLDISHYTLKRLVNHKTQESQDVTAGYIVPNMERLRKATQQITDYIIDVVQYDKSKRIVSFEQARKIS